MNRELSKQRELAKLMGPNPRSPLDFLKDLSSSVNKDVVLDITQFQVGAAPSTAFNPSADQAISITVLASNPQGIDKLAEIVNRKISGVQKSKIEEVLSSDGTNKRWKVTFSGKPNSAEDSYGK